MYVGITRAKEQLALSFARRKRRFGEIIANDPSRFLAELPAADLHWSGRDAEQDEVAAQGSRQFEHRQAGRPVRRLKSLGGTCCEHRSDQLAGLELALQIGVVDRRGDDAGDAERGFHDQHRDQQLPGPGPDLAADDACVEEIFELVDDDQERQRRNRDPQARPTARSRRSACSKSGCRSPAAGRRRRSPRPGSWPAAG